MENVLKTVSTVFLGFFTGILVDIIPLTILAMTFVVIDCITAFRLSKRLSKLCKKGTVCGKFLSKKMGKTIIEFTVIIPVGLMLAYCVQEYLFMGKNMYLPQVFAGFIIFWQIWSILENESSCNGSKWAKLAQKIFVDKTERHFNINLNDLKSNT